MLSLLMTGINFHDVMVIKLIKTNNAFNSKLMHIIIAKTDLHSVDENTLFQSISFISSIIIVIGVIFS